MIYNFRLKWQNIYQFLLLSIYLCFISKHNCILMTKKLQFSVKKCFKLVPVADNLKLPLCTSATSTLWKQNMQTCIKLNHPYLLHQVHLRAHLTNASLISTAWRLTAHSALIFWSYLSDLWKRRRDALKIWNCAIFHRNCKLG